MKGTIIPIVIGAFGTITKGLLKGLDDLEVGDEWRPSKWQPYWKQPEYWKESWRLEEICIYSNSSYRPSAIADVKNSLVIKLEELQIRSNRDHLNYSVIKICQNTEKSPGNLRRHADTQIQLKYHQLMLVYKTRKG